ncbi:MAG TPA: hypothetical protein VFC93_15545 [Chloroflexota bacterium]|nr:hypothetical protein [Chloroflexota bacterium]
MDVGNDRAKYFADPRKELAEPPTPEEIERRHEHWRRVDRARVKVGRAPG